MTHRVRWDPKTKRYVGLDEAVKEMPSLDEPTTREPKLRPWKQRRDDATRNTKS